MVKGPQRQGDLVGSLDVGTGDLYDVGGKPMVGPAADKAKLQGRLDQENRDFNEWHASQGHSVPHPDYNPSNPAARPAPHSTGISGRFKALRAAGVPHEEAKAQLRKKG